MKTIRTIVAVLAIGASAALFCEACHFLGATAARTSFERTQL